MTLFCTLASAQSGELRLLSHGASGILGQQGNRDARVGRTAISGDGRFTVFSTASNNLVANDMGRVADVFLSDGASGAVTRISQRVDGGEPDGDSYDAAISADGRWIAFLSNATDLLSASGGGSGVYLHDRQSGQTRRVTASAGTGSNQYYSAPSLSADGAVLVFGSTVQLIAADDDDRNDAYAYYRNSDSLQLLNRRADGSTLGEFRSGISSVSADGRYATFATYWLFSVPGTYGGLIVRDLTSGTLDFLGAPEGAFYGNSSNDAPSFSADGRLLAFSTSSALLPIDTNGLDDIYLFDRVTRAVDLISVSSAGALSNRPSRAPSLSGDGSAVVFSSQSTTFSPGADPEFEEVYLRRRGPRTTTVLTRPLDGALPSGTLPDRYAGRAISLDGSKVLLQSAAPGLVKGDTNRREDAFVVDTATREATRVSLSATAPMIAGASGTRLNDYGVRPFVSADGHEAIFNTTADNLAIVAHEEIMRHDLVSGITTSTVTGDLPPDETPNLQVAEGFSDDGTSALFRRAPQIFESWFEPPPPPISPRDVWLSSWTMGFRRIDTAPELGAVHSCDSAVMSGDANRIAFTCTRYDLASWQGGVYLYRTQSFGTSRIDVSPSGAAANKSPGTMLGMSHNGRFVAFDSAADNLVPGDSVGSNDLFVRDLDAGGLTRIVQPGTGSSVVTLYASGRIGVSDDGNVIAFESTRAGLVPTLTQGVGVFRLDRSGGELRHVSNGLPGNDSAGSISLSADGRILAFRSEYGLVDADTNQHSDVYVFDALAQSLALASTDAAGTAGNGDSGYPQLSPDGKVLVFSSVASNWNTTPRTVGDVDVFLKRLLEAPLFGSGFE